MLIRHGHPTRHRSRRTHRCRNHPTAVGRSWPSLLEVPSSRARALCSGPHTPPPSARAYPDRCTVRAHRLWVILQAVQVDVFHCCADVARHRAAPRARPCHRLRLTDRRPLRACHCRPAWKHQRPERDSLGATALLRTVVEKSHRLPPSLRREHANWRNSTIDHATSRPCDDRGEEYNDFVTTVAGTSQIQP